MEESNATFCTLPVSLLVVPVVLSVVWTVTFLPMSEAAYCLVVESLPLLWYPKTCATSETL